MGAARGEMLRELFFKLFFYFFLFRNRHRVYFGQEIITHNSFKWQNYTRKRNSPTWLELKNAFGRIPPLFAAVQAVSISVGVYLFLLRIFPQSGYFFLFEFIFF